MPCFNPEGLARECLSRMRYTCMTHSPHAQGYLISHACAVKSNYAYKNSPLPKCSNKASRERNYSKRKIFGLEDHRIKDIKSKTVSTLFFVTLLTNPIRSLGGIIAKIRDRA